MLKRPSRTLTKSIVEEIIKQPDDGWCTTLQKKNPVAVALGRLGNMKGGKADGISHTGKTQGNRAKGGSHALEKIEPRI